MADVVHLKELVEEKGVCGSTEGSFVGNHKLVSCAECRKSKLWRHLHRVRWNGQRCECLRPTRKRKPEQEQPRGT